jgi:hypothetical protein
MKRGFPAILFFLFCSAASAQLLNPIVNFGKPRNLTPIIGNPQSLGATSTGSTTGTSYSSAYTNNVLSGDLLLACSWVGAVSGSISTTGVSDGTNSYTSIIGANYLTAVNVSLWYKANASAVSSGTNLTASYSATNNAAMLLAFRISGLVTSPLDKDSANQASSTTTVSTSTGTLAKANEFVAGCSSSSNNISNTYSGASGFTGVNSVGQGVVNGVITSLDGKIVSATTSVTYSPTWSISQSAVAAIVASFKGN